ncbi:lysophospholipid acyltransferase family protein [Luteimonas sp. RD2P54]|uniref:Lysophospholipid acyltransferase family protein n=1 Tax=Luteimonas endophytica TaxID=3042023 RepID=A0ABT6J947_9GAMM|nr:lysophospholipid acyltransferase family protein [Luteimonas endophytica]MDH5823279.1 lysophospholipid acyltransferase family protein [Luteimonas endophytica]
MNRTPPPPDAAAPAPAASRTVQARAVRYAYRVPMLLWHLLVDLPLLLLALNPLTGGLRLAGGERLDHRLIRAWSAGLMRVFGFRLRRSGTPVPAAALFVANHVSWVDIVALHSQRMMGFVAKKEISRWPLVGWLASRGETIFHQRGSQESLGGVLHEMLARLRGGHSVGVFPEGRTRDGRSVGPFHARIFLAAVEAGVAVQPVALRYGDRASAQTVVAFHPGESFLGNFLRLLGEPARSAEVAFLAPIAPGDADGRRRIAEVARQRIVAAMGGDPGPPAA